MPRILEIKIPHHKIQDAAWIRERIAGECGLKSADPFAYAILRRNIDARSREVQYVLKVELRMPGEAPFEKTIRERHWPKLADGPPVLIVGAGPCGYFAALHLLTLGIRPMVIDRGKDVQARRRDLRAIQQFGLVNPDSNYCFGEGGAGTYSDGKLYTRSDKRGDIRNVLDWLVQHGAVEDILVDAHPHIGSNKLPPIIASIRKTIEDRGGSVHFDTRLEDIVIRDGKIVSAVCNTGVIDTGQIILATGHSARDIYRLLLERNVALEAKDFALGLRIEHPQSLIDKIQYHCDLRPDTLPAAAYSLSCQVDGKGVFSFCMCPGGLIIPAATAPGEIVVNGMSLSRRDSPYANSGLVTSVDATDFKPFRKEGILQGMYFQASVEQAMFRSGDGSQKAPAQRMVDFIRGNESKSLPGSSYIPGLFTARLDELLPAAVSQRLRQGLAQLGKKVPGYLSEEAVLVGTESRTSAPVRIPRDRDSCEHPGVRGLFPAGEGAGYAGGILSAAMDGVRVAEALAASLRA
jgi:uncharacterized FAD-dependent dehydrogenase